MTTTLKEPKPSVLRTEQNEEILDKAIKAAKNEEKFINLIAEIIVNIIMEDEE